MHSDPKAPIKNNEKTALFFKENKMFIGKNKR